MRGSILRQTSEEALERACRDVEATVSRVAKVVLHASALADRIDTTAPTEAHTALQRQERLRVLRGAAEAGRRTIWQVELAAVSAGADTHIGTAPD
jgi:hypothetical protein